KMGDDVPCVSHVSCAENNPAKQSQNEGAYQHDCLANEGFSMQTDQAKDPIAPTFGRGADEEVKSIQHAPDHIRPVRTVPETADGESNHHCQQPAPHAKVTTPHRDIQVIAEPAGK